MWVKKNISGHSEKAVFFVAASRCGTITCSPGCGGDCTSTWELIRQKTAVARCSGTWPMIFQGHGCPWRRCMRPNQETRTTTKAMTTKSWARDRGQGPRDRGQGPRSLIHVDPYWPHANFYWPCKHLDVFTYLQTWRTNRKAKTPATKSFQQSAKRRRIQEEMGNQRRKQRFQTETRSLQIILRNGAVKNQFRTGKGTGNCCKRVWTFPNRQNRV